MYNTGMRELPERVYVDATVVGGLFDKNDHPKRVRPFWNAVKRGEIRVVLSSVLLEEIEIAPPHVREFFRTIPESQIERVVSTGESDALAEQYVRAGIVKPKSLNDCKHVALASIAGVDVLVSFNCEHIVKLNRIRKYNAINAKYGYSQIEIRTPDEVIHDET